MKAPNDVEIANIVASGKLDVELDLSAVAEDLEQVNEWIESVEHSRRRGNRLLIYFKKGDALGILAPTGVYVINGVSSYEDVKEAREQLFSALAQLGIISDIVPSPSEVEKEFEVQNMVLTADLEHELNLSALAIGIGLEWTEYEPEQFPGLVYRPENLICTILVFATGKLVIMGVKNIEEAKEGYNQAKERTQTILDI